MSEFPLWADNQPEAELMAKRNTPSIEKSVNGESFLIEIRKRPEVRVNNSEKIPNTLGGWHFTFTYRNETGWTLVHTQETN